MTMDNKNAKLILTPGRPELPQCVVIKITFSLVFLTAKSENKCNKLEFILYTMDPDFLKPSIFIIH